jgi:hypothetical protein
MATAEVCTAPASGAVSAPRTGRRAAVWRGLGEVVSLDLRSLAVFRIGLGLLLLADLAVRAGDMGAHYTDQGVLPREEMSGSAATSLHLLHGSLWFEACLFGVAALFALALVVGFYSRVASFASCFLLVSLHGRNPLVLDGGDVLLRALLFWGMFLPLGARFSLDALRRGGLGPPPRLASVATAALTLQVCFVYWFSALLKTDPSWRTEGTAIYYALSIDQFATRLGRHLLDYPDLLRALTFATLWMEALGPALLFVPWARGPVRLFAVASFLLFHLVGLNLALELGHFPYVCAVAWLALLPSEFWDRLGRRQGTAERRPASGGGSASTGTPAWVQVVAGFFLVYVFLWNVRTLDFERFETIFPQRLNWIGEGFGLDQMWGMFAPYPLKDDGWYVVVGTREDGREVDLLRGGAPVSWNKPELVSATYQNTRWRKYMVNLWQKEHAAHRARFARYLCREWDARHGEGERLREIEIYYMLEVTLPDYQTAPPQKVLLCQYP